MPVCVLRGFFMDSRSDYFKDLIVDAVGAVDELGIPADQQGAIIAALIESDSLNGVRKALLQALTQRGART